MLSIVNNRFTGDYRNYFHKVMSEHPNHQEVQGSENSTCFTASFY